MNKPIGFLFALGFLLSFSGSLSADTVQALKAYESGNYKLAFKYFNQSALDGDPAAQNNLAVMYVNGQGIKQDYTVAAQWYTEAAEQGLLDAQYNIATMYYEGKGVVQDTLSALVWYHLAATQGDAMSQLKLGQLYASGEGVEREPPLAYFWLVLASTRSLNNAIQKKAGAALRTLEQQLTQDQIADAKIMAESWRPES